MSTLPDSPAPAETPVAHWELPSLGEQPVCPLRIVIGRLEAAAPELDAAAEAALPLDRPLAAPVEIEVDGQVTAAGEVVVMEGRLAVRVTELRTTRETMA